MTNSTSILSFQIIHVGNFLRIEDCNLRLSRIVITLQTHSPKKNTYVVIFNWKQNKKAISDKLSEMVMFVDCVNAINIVIAQTHPNSLISN